MNWKSPVRCLAHPVAERIVESGIHVAEEALHRCVVPAVGLAPHRATHAVAGEQMTPRTGWTQLIVATPDGGVAMTKFRRRSDMSGRAPLFSPDPPIAARHEQQRFWAAIAAGMASEDAAAGANISQAVGTRLFRKAGGMPLTIFSVISEATGWPVPLLCGARGDRTSPRAILLRAGGCVSAGAKRLNNLTGVAAQCRDARRRHGLSSNDSAMACRPICSPTKAGETCAQRSITNLCGGATGSGRGHPEWGSCSRPGCTLERLPAWTAAASVVDKCLEPGTDCSPPAGRLPG